MKGEPCQGGAWDWNEEGTVWDGPGTVLRGQLWGLKDTVRGGELCQVDIGIGMMMVPHGDSSEDKGTQAEIEYNTEVEYGLEMDGKKRIQYGYFKGLRDQRWKESRGWEEGDFSCPKKVWFYNFWVDETGHILPRQIFPR